MAIQRVRILPVAVLLSLACGALAGAGVKPSAPDPEWKPHFKGVDLATWQQACDENADWPIAVYAVRVDLTVPGLRFLTTPSNGDDPKETDGLKTSAFLKKHKCQVAINASPFAPVGEKDGPTKDIIGLSVSKGEQYSGPHRNNGALLITRDNKVRISRPPFDLENVHNAVGGFAMLLKEGKIVASGEKRHPRTAAGLSRDERYLYAAVIDGRQLGHSVGTTPAETAKIMLHVGAYTALNLDGGGSTTLVVDDGKGGVRIVNRPIHNRIPGTERVNGNHLGIFAEALTDE